MISTLSEKQKQTVAEIKASFKEISKEMGITVKFQRKMLLKHLGVKLLASKGQLKRLLESVEKHINYIEANVKQLNIKTSKSKDKEIKSELEDYQKLVQLKEQITTRIDAKESKSSIFNLGFGVDKGEIDTDFKDILEKKGPKKVEETEVPETELAAKIKSTNKALKEEISAKGKTEESEIIGKLIKTEDDSSERQKNPINQKLLNVNEKILGVITEIHEDMIDEQDTSIKKAKTIAPVPEFNTETMEVDTKKEEKPTSSPGLGNILAEATVDLLALKAMKDMASKAMNGLKSIGTKATKFLKNLAGKKPPVPTSTVKPGGVKPGGVKPGGVKPGGTAKSVTGMMSKAGNVTKGALKFSGKAAGPLAAVAFGVYDAYTGVQDANEKLEAGEITEEEASKAKGEAIGGATVGTGGAMAGAAAGAAIGSVVPVVGTLIGGIIGGAVGYWAGSKAGGALGNALAGPDTSEEEMKPYIDAGIVKYNTYGIAGNEESEIKDWEKLKELPANDIKKIINFDDWTEDDRNKMFVIFKEKFTAEEATKKEEAAKAEEAQKVQQVDNNIKSIEQTKQNLLERKKVLEKEGTQEQVQSIETALERLENVLKILRQKQREFVDPEFKKEMDEKRKIQKELEIRKESVKSISTTYKDQQWMSIGEGSMSDVIAIPKYNLNVSYNYNKEQEYKWSENDIKKMVEDLLDGKEVSVGASYIPKDANHVNKSSEDKTKSTSDVLPSMMKIQDVQLASPESANEGPAKTVQGLKVSGPTSVNTEDYKGGDVLDVNLVRIASASGKGTYVDERWAPNFQGFINELEGTGYEIRQLGGYVNRNMRGGNRKSYHAFGAAIDINWNENPMGKQFITDMDPDVVGPMAAKYGLGWGGNWKSVKDAMHFSVGKSEGGPIPINRSQPVRVTGWNKNYKYEAPAGEDSDKSGGIEFGQKPDKMTSTGGKQTTPNTPAPAIQVTANKSKKEVETFQNSSNLAASQKSYDSNTAKKGAAAGAAIAVNANINNQNTETKEDNHRLLSMFT